MVVGGTCHDGMRRRTSHLKKYHSRKKNIYTDNDTAEQGVNLAKIRGMSSYAEIAASAHIGLKTYLRQKVDEFIEHFRNTDEVIRLEIADYTGALPQLRIWKKWSTVCRLLQC